jgi:hypothetical protein
MSAADNRVLIVGGSVLAVAVCIELALLGFAYAGMARTRSELAFATRRLDQLQNRNPFPSADNVDAMADNLERLEYELDELGAEMMRDPFPQDAVEAADFSARAQDVIERFRKRAERAGVELPETLEAGFSQYASGGAVPAAEHVPRLSRQLYSVERVADIMVRSGVSAITELSRDSFELRREDPPPRSRRRPGRAQPGPQGGGDRVAASAVHPEGFYYIERVGIAFEADEEAVWRALNLFSSSPHFMAVRVFSHRYTTRITTYNPEDVKRGGAVDDETLNYLAEGILVGEKALSRPERIIAGNELIEVRILVEVFNFEPEGMGR